MNDQMSDCDMGKAYSACAGQLKMSDAHYSAVARYVVANTSLTDNDRILEAGCGNGYLTKLMLERMASHRVKSYALDISTSMVRNSSRTNPMTMHTVAALPHVPFRDGQFKAVVCSEVLEHCSQPKASLEELRRVLTDDGSLIVTIPNADWLGFDRYIRSRRKFQPADDFFYTFGEAQHLFRQAGLRVHDYAGLGGCVAASPAGGILGRVRNRFIMPILGGVVRRLHPDAARVQKRIMLTLRKDDYLLGHDF